MARTIQSPGVEINEIDFTLRAEPSVGTNILITGFANQGPIDEVLQPSTLSEFEQIYGSPTNAAERYFYHSVKNVMTTSQGNVLVSRLPYGEGRGDGFTNWRYSALAYPVRGAETLLNTVSSFEIENVLLSLSGYGYTSAPDIDAIGGGGFGFSVTPNMADDGRGTNTFGISSITINSVGSDYTSIPAINVSKSYIIETITVTSSGAGYSVPPTVQILGNATVEAVAIANMANDDLGTGTYGVSSITLTFEGTGYTSVPSVQINGSASTQATAVAEYIDASASVFIVGDQTTTEAYNTSETTLSASKTYFFGQPVHVELSAEEYQQILNGGMNWNNNPTTSNISYNNLGDAGIVILNKSQTTINNKFEGYYIGLADNNNFNPATNYDSILNVKTIQESSNSIYDYVTVPKNRLNFSLSATKTGDGSSISEKMESFTQYELSNLSFNDTLSLGLFKLRQSVFTPDSISLDYVLSESYTGSLDYHRQIGDNNGGPAKSFYIGKTSEGSPNINIFVNNNISNKNGKTWLDNDGLPSKKVRFLTKQLEEPLVSQGFKDTIKSYVTRVGATSSYVADFANFYGYADALFPLGIYSDTGYSEKTIGSLPKKIERVFDLVENSDVYPIDIAIEAGLGTIFVNAIEQSNISNYEEYDSAGSYDDSIPLKSLSGFYSTSFDDLGDELLRIRGNYTSVSNVFVNAAERQRKDFIAILDPIRNIFIQGENGKVINQKKTYSPNAGVESDPNASGYVATNFSQHIYWPLRHQFGTTDCSYATTYANWAQVYDSYSGRQVWVPFSGVAAGIMAKTDDDFQPWFAPAGFTRGIVSVANDLAIYPKQKQRDQLYKISMNPVAFFPNEGFVVFGQKTMLKKPSAFDRINVRRLFLTLEKITKNAAKYFVFEPNTLFTRTQVVNVLTPIFENAKNTEGLYDYRIVCSELNNTPDVIDNNELKIDIYIQPVRTAEFILVNFYATRTGTNFDEIIGTRR